MNDQTKQQDPAIINAKEVIISFPHLFKAHAMEEGQEAKFGCTVIFDNEKHSQLLDRIENVIADLAKKQWGNLPKMPHYKSCLRDGNEKSDKEGYGDGVSFISCSRKSRPAVVNRDLSPITEEDGIIAGGDICNISLKLWVMDNKFGRRICAELRAVQFVREGERFGAGAVKVEDEFEALPDEGGSEQSSTPSNGGSHRSQRSTKPATAPADDNY